MKSRPALTLLWSLALVGLVTSLRADEELRITNWAAPPYWAPPADVAQEDAAATGERTPQGGIHPLSVPTPPLAFVAVAPCRIVDTRTANNPLRASVPRDFPIAAAACGIPVSAQAVSLNITVTNTQGSGDIRVYPQGSAMAAVSTLNFVGGQTIANAAVVAVGTNGGVTVVAAVSQTDLLLDVNGYYASQRVVTSVNSISGDLGLAPAGSALIWNTGNTLNLFAPNAGAGLLVTQSGSLATRQFDVVFGGNGAANSVARSDHDHLGATWTGGSQGALTLETSHPGGTWLNLRNTSPGGNEWNVISTGSPENSEGPGKLLFRVTTADVAQQLSPNGDVWFRGNLSAKNLAGQASAESREGLGLARGTTTPLDIVKVNVPASGFLVVTGRAHPNTDSTEQGNFCTELQLRDVDANSILTTARDQFMKQTNAVNVSQDVHWVIPVSAGTRTLQTFAFNCSNLDAVILEHALIVLYVPAQY